MDYFLHSILKAKFDTKNTLKQDPDLANSEKALDQIQIGWLLENWSKLNSEKKLHLSSVCVFKDRLKDITKAKSDHVGQNWIISKKNMAFLFVAEFIRNGVECHHRILLFRLVFKHPTLSSDQMNIYNSTQDLWTLRFLGIGCSGGFIFYTNGKYAFLKTHTFKI